MATAPLRTTSSIFHQTPTIHTHTQTTPTMPTSQLFGDDDSDDSSAAAPEETKKTTSTAEESKADDDEDVEMKDADADKKKDDDGDEDEEEEEMKDSDAEKTKTNEEETKKTAEDRFDSDSSSSDDAKKDDAADKEKEKDPFAEESDSDDDKKDESADKEKEKEKDPFDEDSSDSDNDVKKKSKPDEKKADNNNDDDDDNLLEDSDDGDAEFDDAGGITGTGHTKGFQRKKSVQKSSLDKAREAEEQAEQEIAAQEEAEAAPKKPRPPKVDPRTMVVAEPDRPPSSASLHITKLPNLVGIQTEAFDAATYSAAQEEKDFHGFVHDMIRWRYKTDTNGDMMRDDDNKLIRESNARLIQWEDGSYTLHVGKETFEVDNIDSSQSITVPDGRKFAFAGLNGYLYLSQIATFREPKEDKKEADEDEGAADKDDATDKAKKEVEYEETPAGTVLECMGAVRSRLTARPLLKSEAHKSLTVAVRQKTIKRAMIAEVVTQDDPEAAKAKRIKTKDDLAKEAARKKSYGDGFSGRNYNRAASRPRPGMNRSYLEDDGDFDTTDIRAMKKRTMNEDDDDMMDDYGDDDSDSEEEATFNRRSARKSNALDDDSDEDSDDPVGGAKKGAKEMAADDDDDDDDDDDEVITPVKTSKKRTHQAVFDDDDSDE